MKESWVLSKPWLGYQTSHACNVKLSESISLKMTCHLSLSFSIPDCHVHNFPNWPLVNYSQEIWKKYLYCAPRASTLLSVGGSTTKLDLIASYLVWRTRLRIVFVNLGLVRFPCFFNSFITVTMQDDYQRDRITQWKESDSALLTIFSQHFIACLSEQVHFEGKYFYF